MIIYIDIDETICSKPNGLDYTTVNPWYDRIKDVNNLFDYGHTIIFWTARGTKTGIDWRALTEKQLNDWGVKYHELIMGKPSYDLFIDDKNYNSTQWVDVIENVYNKTKL
jgi:uncharacterized HAD superfamily protein